MGGQGEGSGQGTLKGALEERGSIWVAEVRPEVRGPCEGKRTGSAQAGI